MSFISSKVKSHYGWLELSVEDGSTTIERDFDLSQAADLKRELLEVIDDIDHLIGEE